MENKLRTPRIKLFKLFAVVVLVGTMIVVYQVKTTEDPTPKPHTSLRRLRPVWPELYPISPEDFHRKDTGSPTDQSTKSTTSTDHITTNSLSGYESILAKLDKSLHKLFPKPSSIDEYMLVPNVDMMSAGDVEQPEYNSALEAAQRCDVLGASCKGFVTSVETIPRKHYYMKNQFVVPKHSRDKNLYLKGEYVAEYLSEILESTSLECALPIAEMEQSREGCRLPVLDPFDPAMMKFITEGQIPAQCSGRLYTHFEKGILQLTDDALERGVLQVQYQPILRPSGTGSDYGYTLGNAGTLTAYKTEATINNDFLAVKVFFSDGSSPQIDVHANVVEKQDVIARSQSRESPLDIMILGFDSLSAAHFERMMPLTFAVLKNELKSILFEGFSIVGQATTPALSAMLTGIPLEENCARHEGRRGASNAEPIDRWPFIFKDLKQQGFATMFSEDQPIFGAFNMRILGFDESPVDHYARNFWLYSADRFPWLSCFNSQLQFMLQLNYLKSFIHSYEGVRKFGFTFLSDLCHRTLSHVGVADQHVAKFLKSLQDEHCWLSWATTGLALVTCDQLLRANSKNRYHSSR